MTARSNRASGAQPSGKRLAADVRRIKAGKGLEVTGDDTYRGLTLPLLKAAEHLREVTRHQGSHHSNGRLIATVAVLGAPMIALPDDGRGGLEAIPWVRVLRYEPKPDPRPHLTHRLAAFDVVHEDFFSEYLTQLAMYADYFASTVIRNSKVLLKGAGFASGLGHGARPVEVEPRTAETRSMARRLIAESAWKVLSGRGGPRYGMYVREPLKRRRRN